MVGLGGLEPPTSRLSGVRSNQLSYRPICNCERIDLSKLNNTNPGHSADLKMETCTGRSLYTLIYP